MNITSDSAIDWRATPELALAPASAPPTGAPAGAGGEPVEDDGFRLFGNDGFTFFDFVDIINPLQHIPIIGTFYREMSGDVIDPASRVLGGTLFFGPIGTVASVANVLIENDTGKDIGGHVMAFFDDQGGAPEPIEKAEADDTTGPVLANAGLRQGFQPTSQSAIEPAPNPAHDSAVDPVTAWAISEMAYRQSVADKARVSANATPVRDRGAAPGRPHAPAGIDWEKVRATAAVTQDMRHGHRMAAAASYGMPRPTAGNGTPSKARQGDDTSRTTGAIAAHGGWFSETMLSALNRYEGGTQSRDAERPHLLDFGQ